MGSLKAQILRWQAPGLTLFLSLQRGQGSCPRIEVTDTIILRRIGVRTYGH